MVSALDIGDRGYWERAPNAKRARSREIRLRGELEPRGPDGRLNRWPLPPQQLGVSQIESSVCEEITGIQSQAIERPQWGKEARTTHESQALDTIALEPSPLSVAIEPSTSFPPRVRCRTPAPLLGLLACYTSRGSPFALLAIRLNVKQEVWRLLRLCVRFILLSLFSLRPIVSCFWLPCPAGSFILPCPISTRWKLRKFATRIGPRLVCG